MRRRRIAPLHEPNARSRLRQQAGQRLANTNKLDSGHGHSPDRLKLRNSNLIRGRGPLQPLVSLVDHLTIRTPMRVGAAQAQTRLSRSAGVGGHDTGPLRQGRCESVRQGGPFVRARCPPPAHRRLGDSRARARGQPVDIAACPLRAPNHDQTRPAMAENPGESELADSCEGKEQLMARQVGPACHEPEPALGPFEVVWEMRRGVRGFHQGPGTRFPLQRPNTSVQLNLLARTAPPLQMRGGPYKRGLPARGRPKARHGPRGQGCPRSREVVFSRSPCSRPENCA